MLFHGQGLPAEAALAAIRSWKSQGYPVHRLFFFGSDAGEYYTSGRADGSPHTGEIDLDAEGRRLQLGSRPYMVPTSGWHRYLDGLIAASIEAGAEGIWPEEPLLHASGGYSPAFKDAWQAFYGRPWEPPHASPAAFFRASRLKSELLLRGVRELSESTRTRALAAGRPVRFYLPVHSPISYASWRLLFPHAAAAQLPMDGMLAQVWTGPARWPLTVDGVTRSRAFESNWLLYGAFAGLVEGRADRHLYFLADPSEDDARGGWAESERWYRAGLCASLFFPRADGYEVMPWPERIYPSGTVGERGPAPDSYRTVLGSVVAALREMPAAAPVRWGTATTGIGVVTFDTLQWQRGGPQGSNMRGLHGLTLPLLTRGVPIEMVAGERMTEAGLLDRYRILLLSYDMQKPLSPDVHGALARWVRAGGTLLLFGGEDVYNSIDEWWNQAGFVGPTEQLLHELGSPADLAGRSVQGGPGRFRSALRAESRVSDGSNRAVLTLPLPAAADRVIVRFSDRFAEDGCGPRVGRVRLKQGDRVRAEFVAGSAGERPFLVDDHGSQTGEGYRFADGDASWSYRFVRPGAGSVLEVEAANQYEISIADEQTPERRLTGAPSESFSVGVSAEYPVVTYPAAAAQALYSAGNQSVVWKAPVGAGLLVYSGLPASFFADSPGGGELLRRLVRVGAEAEKLPYGEGPIIQRRGPYFIGWSAGQAVEQKGLFLDLFDPDLAVRRNPWLPYRDPVLWKEVKPNGKAPSLLHAAHRARVLEASPARMRLQLEGPEGGKGIARIGLWAMTLASVEAVDAAGRPVRVEATIESPTLRLRYPLTPGGITVTFRWMPMEERLTR